MTLKIILFVMITFVAQLAAANPDVDDASVNELQGMMNNIESELEARGVSVRDKQGRIEKAQSRMQRIVNRGSWKNAILGSVLTAAVTAHPAGLLVGGLAGGMVGRSKNYNKVEERLATIEREILLDEDDFLTEEEMRLARFSGDLDNTSVFNPDVTPVLSDDQRLVDEHSNPMDIEVDSVVQMEPEIQTPNFNAPRQDEQRIKVAQAPFKVSSNASVNAPQNNDSQQSAERVELESCYGRSVGDRKSRERLPHCFYMMY